MWSFVDLHNEFYGQMVDKWNEENPDKQIQITFSTYPYSDMHNKLMMSLQAGSGAPDLCDIEIGQFPNYSGDDSPLYSMKMHLLLMKIQWCSQDLMFIPKLTEQDLVFLSM